MPLMDEGDMADDSALTAIPPTGLSDPRQLMRYIEDMLLELAQMASAVGESGLAASLAIAAIQAGAAGDRRGSTLT